LKHLTRSLVVLLIVTCAWRYGRESVRAWLAQATRVLLAAVPSSVELPAGEHYSPAEDLERLDYEAIRGARRSLDIATFSFTDVLYQISDLPCGKSREITFSFQPTGRGDSWPCLLPSCWKLWGWQTRLRRV
jgi:hypothetical protein